MAKVSFANLSQDFVMWRDEIDNHATDKAIDHFTTITASGHDLTIHGTGLEYQNGVPRAGSVSSLDISLGGAKAVPDIVVGEINTDFINFAAMVAPMSPVDRTMALWSAALRGDDQIDFGPGTSAKNIRVEFAGDGNEAPSNRMGGNDVIRGDLGAGAITGDYFTVGGTRKAFGGNDDIRLSGSEGAYVSGDLIQVANEATFVAGNDKVGLDRQGTVVGDAGKIFGLLVAGNDTIDGSEAGDTLLGDVDYAISGSSVIFGEDLIRGGDGNDVIRGDYSSNGAVNFRGGDDRLFGDNGEDFVSGDEGNDYVDGGADSDILVGGAGDDTLRGGTGNDTMTGGTGFDTVDYGDKTASVRIRLDFNGSGLVEVNRSVEDVIEQVENLIGGSAGDEFHGANDYTGNRFEGRGGNDSLDGGGGSDTLIGASGNDKLRGGSGLDHFVFNAKLAQSNIDRIVDFEHGTDKIELDDAIFKALGASFEKVEFAAFSHGHDATTASQHVIYDKATGSLWYDADGKGGHFAVQFAHLGTASAHPADLNWHDFAIV